MVASRRIQSGRVTIVERKILERIGVYVDEIADYQITQFEREAHAEAGEHREYAQAVAELEESEAALIEKLGGDAMATEDMMSACRGYAAALAAGMYKRGVMDGGRLFYAFIAHDLPEESKA